MKKVIKKSLAMALVFVLTLTMGFSAVQKVRITALANTTTKTKLAVTASAPKSPIHRTEITYFTPEFVEEIDKPHVTSSGITSEYGHPNMYTSYLLSEGSTQYSYGVGLSFVSISISNAASISAGGVSLSPSEITQFYNGEIYNRLFFKAKIYKQEYRIDYYVIVNNYLERSEYKTRYYHTNTNGYIGAVTYYCNPISR